MKGQLARRSSRSSVHCPTSRAICRHGRASPSSALRGGGCNGEQEPKHLDRKIPGLPDPGARLSPRRPRAARHLAAPYPGADRRPFLSKRAALPCPVQRRLHDAGYQEREAQRASGARRLRALSSGVMPKQELTWRLTSAAADRGADVENEHRAGAAGVARRPRHPFSGRPIVDGRHPPSTMKKGPRRGWRTMTPGGPSGISTSSSRACCSFAPGPVLRCGGPASTLGVPVRAIAANSRNSRCGTVFGHTGSILGYTQLIAATRDGETSITFSVNSQVGEEILPALRHAQELAVCTALGRNFRDPHS
jgi:hypothetical protein